MTPAALAAALIAAGFPISGFALVAGLVRLDVVTPSGIALSADVPILTTDEETLANAQSVVRYGLTPFETDVGRGFNNTGRGALSLQRGFRANDGYV